MWSIRRLMRASSAARSPAETPETSRTVSMTRSIIVRSVLAPRTRPVAGGVTLALLPNGIGVSAIEVGIVVAPDDVAVAERKRESSNEAGSAKDVAAAVFAIRVGAA